MASLVPNIRHRLVTATYQISRQSLRPFSYSVRVRAGDNTQIAPNPDASRQTPNVSKTNEGAVDAYGAQDTPLQEYSEEAEKMRSMQAPNRASTWSRSQMPRELAMSGPRFEQTIIEVQPRPLAAIELIHQQPVRWVNSSSVACDGGGGPLGHPKIFINLDKPQICWCTYCGLPYAHTHHKKHLESLPPDQLSYPLAPTNDPAQVRMPESPSQNGEIQGHYPTLKGEVEAEGVDKQPYAQR